MTPRNEGLHNRETVKKPLREIIDRGKNKLKLVCFRGLVALAHRFRLPNTTAVKIVITFSCSESLHLST